MGMRHLYEVQLAHGANDWLKGRQMNAAADGAPQTLAFPRVRISNVLATTRVFLLHVIGATLFCETVCSCFAAAETSPFADCFSTLFAQFNPLVTVPQAMKALAEESHTKWSQYNANQQALRTKEFCSGCKDFKGFECLQSLFDGGVDIDGMHKFAVPSGEVWEDTPLGWAVDGKNDRLVSWLVARGAAVNKLSGYGSTPLHLAAQMGQLNIVQTLVYNGADVKLKSTSGMDALAWATQDAHPNYDGEPTAREMCAAFLQTA